MASWERIVTRCEAQIAKLENDIAAANMHTLAESKVKDFHLNTIQEMLDRLEYQAKEISKLKAHNKKLKKLLKEQD